MKVKPEEIPDTEPSIQAFPQRAQLFAVRKSRSALLKFGEGVAEVVG